MNSAAGERREIEYAVHGGVSLKGQLYAPKGPGKFPLVIAVHGGGWRLAQISRPRDPIVEKFLGASLIDDRRIYFDASPLSYVSARNSGTAFFLAWGTADDIVDPATQSEAFLEALKQAGHYVRPAVIAGAPHFWIGDPIDEPGSHSGFFAQRLLRFLQARL